MKERVRAKVKVRERWGERGGWRGTGERGRKTGTKKVSGKNECGHMR